MTGFKPEDVGELSELPEPPVTISQLQQMVGDWASRVFPKRTIRTTLDKLVMEEIPEFLLSKGNDPGEYADLLILVLDLAHQKGIDAGAAALAKHRVNEQRAWEMTSDGVYHHIAGVQMPKGCTDPSHHPSCTGDPSGAECDPNDSSECEGSTTEIGGL